MEALSTASLMLGLYSTAFYALEIIGISPLYRSYKELEVAYKPFRALILLFVFPDAKKVIDRIQAHILPPGRHQECMVMKKSLADECKMLAVAAAIFAQIAITALSLEDLSAVHWTSKAAFVLSLVTGSLSVFFSCLLQQHISSLFGPEDVKSWLSQPADRTELNRINREVNGYLNEGSRITRAEIDQRITEAADKGRWKKASVNAAFMIKVPSSLLKWSVGAFLIGLGVYLGYVWDHNLGLPQSRKASLGVLIVYIVSTVVGLSLFFIPKGFKFLEAAPIRWWDRMLDEEKGLSKRTYENLFRFPGRTISTSQDPQSISGEQIEHAKDTGPRPPLHEPKDIQPTDDPLITALESFSAAQHQSLAALQTVLNATLQHKSAEEWVT